MLVSTPYLTMEDSKPYDCTGTQETHFQNLFSITNHVINSSNWTNFIYKHGVRVDLKVIWLFWPYLLCTHSDINWFTNINCLLLLSETRCTECEWQSSIILILFSWSIYQTWNKWSFFQREKPNTLPFDINKHWEIPPGEISRSSLTFTSKLYLGGTPQLCSPLTAMLNRPTTHPKKTDL